MIKLACDVFEQIVGNGFSLGNAKDRVLFALEDLADELAIQLAEVQSPLHRYGDGDGHNSKALDCADLEGATSDFAK